jgi:hypothetical protein
MTAGSVLQALSILVSKIDVLGKLRVEIQDKLKLVIINIPPVSPVNPATCSPQLTAGTELSKAVDELSIRVQNLITEYSNLLTSIDI